MIEITLASAIEGITALVEEKGSDFVYQQREGKNGGWACKYVHEGQPDCIVGQFLAALGIPLEWLKRADTASGASGINAGGLINGLKYGGLVTASDDAVGFLMSVQYDQDNKRTWGEALANAKLLSGE